MTNGPSRSDVLSSFYLPERKIHPMTVVLASVAFWAPCELTLPGDDGKPEIVKFRARFKRLKRSERVELERRMHASRMEYEAALRGEKAPASDAKPIMDAEVLSLVLQDLDLTDKAGKQVMYTPAVSQELAEDWDGFEAAIVGAFFKALRMQADPHEAAKNSVPQSATP